MSPNDLNRIREQLELLTGERGAQGRPLSAVRRQEIANLAKLTMKSSQISAAPTQDDFNALQEDVANVVKALTQISNIFGTARITK